MRAHVQWEGRCTDCTIVWRRLHVHVRCGVYACCSRGGKGKERSQDSCEGAHTGRLILRGTSPPFGLNIRLPWCLCRMPSKSEFVDDQKTMLWNYAKLACPQKSAAVHTEVWHGVGCGFVLMSAYAAAGMHRRLFEPARQACRGTLQTSRVHRLVCRALPTAGVCLDMCLDIRLRMCPTRHCLPQACA